MNLSTLLDTWPAVARQVSTTSQPAHLTTAAGTLARVAPPGKVVPDSFERFPLGTARERHRPILAALLRGEPIVLTYYEMPVFILVPGA